MNYEDMSNGELTIKLLNAIDDEIYGLRKSDLTVCCSWQGGVSKFDPFNNDNHLIPIMIRHRFNLIHDGAVWDCSVDVKDNHIFTGDASYARAIVVCFLKMKDAENES